MSKIGAACLLALCNSLDVRSRLQRAEHNEGLLSNLQEITLHGQNLEQIEVVGHVCRHLKILYLQNNVIGIIENLHHLKVVYLLPKRRR